MSPRPVTPGPTLPKSHEGLGTGIGSQKRSAPTLPRRPIPATHSGQTFTVFTTCHLEVQKSDGQGHART